MNKTKIVVQRINIGVDFFDGKTIQQVKEHFDMISNDCIGMLYQGCTSRFDVDYGGYDDSTDIYLIFERTETDEEYQNRLAVRSKEIEKIQELKYKEYLRLKKEFEDKPE
jgi:hypothetical protein